MHYKYQKASEGEEKNQKNFQNSLHKKSPFCQAGESLIYDPLLEQRHGHNSCNFQTERLLSQFDFEANAVDALTVWGLAGTRTVTERTPAGEGGASPHVPTL